MTQPNEINLDVDLKQGMMPISKVASSLAALIKRSRAARSPIVITRKGSPDGVLVDVGVYLELRSLIPGTLPREFNWGVDLLKGVLPISKSASSLAALLRWINANKTPVIITQKGYPSGVLFSVDQWTALKVAVDLATAEQHEDSED